MESIRSTKLIELSDGILIEVEVPATDSRRISSGAADRVQKAIGVIKPLLTKVAGSVYEAIEEIRTTTPVEKAEVEINLGFTVEGDTYIEKLQSNSSLKVKLILKPLEDATLTNVNLKGTKLDDMNLDKATLAEQSKKSLEQSLNVLYLYLRMARHIPVVPVWMSHMARVIYQDPHTVYTDTVSPPLEITCGTAEELPDRAIFVDAQNLPQHYYYQPPAPQVSVPENPPPTDPPTDPPSADPA